MEIYKLYIGIEGENGCYYIAALDDQGSVVIKNQLPIIASSEAIIKYFSAIKEAFDASLKIALCQELVIEPSLLSTLERIHGPVKLVEESLLYSTDFIPADSFYVDNPYRRAIHLAILRSLAE
ncbi:MAG: hypothetical protein QME81_02960 [bacterium]|nr:hypothetical protein [bacterium]